MIIITLVALFLMVRRGIFEQLPIKIRIALVLNPVMLFATIYMMLVVLLRDGYTWAGYAWDSEIRILTAFVGSIWVGIHYQFTAFYMQTACLLRKTLRARTDLEILKVQRRKKIL